MIIITLPGADAAVNCRDCFRCETVPLLELLFFQGNELRGWKGGGERRLFFWNVIWEI